MIKKQEHTAPEAARRRAVTGGRVGLAAALLALSLGTAEAATPPDAWWLDIVNDREENVRRMLGSGVDPNASNAEGLPALMLAIRTGAWGVYDALLANRNTDIEAENRSNETPLMYLALLGETERALELIKRGARVNRLGWTPLHYAASKGQTATARMLLEHDAIVNAPAPDGTTPLMMAAYAGDRATVQLLLDHGADATAVNLQKLTAADWARERRHGALANELDAVAERTQALRQGRPLPDNDSAIAKKKAEDASEPDTGTSRYFDLERFNR